MLRSITITVTIDTLHDDELARLRTQLNDFIDLGAQFIRVNVEGAHENHIGLAEVLSDIQHRLSPRHGMVTANARRNGAAIRPVRPV